PHPVPMEGSDPPPSPDNGPDPPPSPDNGPTPPSSPEYGAGPSNDLTIALQNSRETNWPSTLAHLALTGTSPSSDDIELLCNRMQCLTTLCIIRPASPVSASFLAGVAAASRLTTLTVIDCPMTPDVLADIVESCTRLTKVRIAVDWGTTLWSQFVSRVILPRVNAQLPVWPQLSTLDLRGCLRCSAMEDYIVPHLPHATVMLPAYSRDAAFAF
ncbi:uncharacterized protein AMSG_11566, partial [Thecamonas trahens ATCC 50062]